MLQWQKQWKFICRCNKEISQKQCKSNIDYTIDNPKIIVNPYGNSPLTALVIFKTKDLTSPTITVKGKDDDFTYYLSCIKSKYIEVRYPNGKKENIKEALLKKNASINDLDKFDISYLKYDKGFKD